MADPASVPSAASAMDYREHERTYRGFVGFVKWATIVVALILIMMAIFLL